MGLLPLIVIGVILCVPIVIFILFSAYDCCTNTLTNCIDEYKSYYSQLKLNWSNRPNNIIKTKYGNFDKTSNNFGSECTICMTENTKNLRTLPCKHVFHKRCITTWIKKEIRENHNPSCPICRTEIFDYVELSKIKGTYVPNYSFSINYSSDSDSYDGY